MYKTLNVKFVYTLLFCFFFITFSLNNNFSFDLWQESFMAWQNWSKKGVGHLYDFLLFSDNLSSANIFCPPLTSSSLSTMTLTIRIISTKLTFFRKHNFVNFCMEKKLTRNLLFLPIRRKKKTTFNMISYEYCVYNV